MAKKALPINVVSFSGLQSAYVRAYPPVASLRTFAAGKKIVDNATPNDGEDDDDDDDDRSVESLSFSNKNNEDARDCWCSLFGTMLWIRGRIWGDTNAVAVLDEASIKTTAKSRRHAVHECEFVRFMLCNSDDLMFSV